MLQQVFKLLENYQIVQTVIFAFSIHKIILSYQFENWQFQTRGVFAHLGIDEAADAPDVVDGDDTGGGGAWGGGVRNKLYVTLVMENVNGPVAQAPEAARRRVQPGHG